MDKNSRIYVSGHKGMVGSAVVKLLSEKGYKNLFLIDHNRLDLRDLSAVERFMKKESPEYVFHFAAKVGGIKANIANPAPFLYDNLLITANIIHASYKYNVKKLLNLGSSCIYPRECPQPMKEEYLLTGKLEPTNEGYALAKIIGLKLCELYNKEYFTNYISLMPPNLYGPNDNFNPDSSHVVAGLISKFVKAKKENLSCVEIWGSGNARREFLYVEDLAKACIYFINNYDAKDLPSFLNIGFGSDISIKELVELIKGAIDYRGDISWNINMPDGMPKKLLDITQSKQFGWEAEVSLSDGISRTIDWYVNNL